MPNSRKIDSDSGDKNTSKTTASATLQLIWTDGPNYNNTIDNVSGTLTVNRGTVKSGIVRYGNGWRTPITWEKENVGSNSSFSFNPKLTVPDPSADYSIIFNNETYSLNLRVSANIFQ